MLFILLTFIRLFTKNLHNYFRFFFVFSFYDKKKFMSMGKISIVEFS